MKKLISVIFIVCFSCTCFADTKNHMSLSKSEKKESKATTNEMLKSYLEVSAFRNKVLSQNMANINTPGYKADEVSMPEKYEDLSGDGRSARLGMKVTSYKHISGTNAPQGKFSSHKLKDPDEIKKNGNNVSMRQQMAKISQNKNDYTAAVKAFATSNALYSSVLGK